MEALAVFNQSPSPDKLVNFFNKYGVRSQEMMQQLNLFITEWHMNPSNPDSIASAKEFMEIGAQRIISVPTVGASGAVFGCLAAFGYLFPNTLIYIYFFFPIKAKWFVILYAAAELWMGVRNSGGNVAHFAHLGGALIGFLLVLYWNKNNRKTLY
jgi:hypothetical protein